MNGKKWAATLGGAVVGVVTIVGVQAAAGNTEPVTAARMGPDDSIEVLSTARVPVSEAIIGAGVTFIEPLDAPRGRDFSRVPASTDSVGADDAARGPDYGLDRISGTPGLEDFEDSLYAPRGPTFD